MGYCARTLDVLSWPVHAQIADAPRGEPQDNVYDQATANPKQDHWASKVLQGVKRAIEREPVTATQNGPGTLQTESLAAWAAPLPRRRPSCDRQRDGHGGAVQDVEQQLRLAAIAAISGLQDGSGMGRVLSRARPNGDLRAECGDEYLRWNFLSRIRDSGRDYDGNDNLWYGPRRTSGWRANTFGSASPTSPPRAGMRRPTTMRSTSRGSRSSHCATRPYPVIDPER